MNIDLLISVNVGEYVLVLRPTVDGLHEAAGVRNPSLLVIIGDVAVPDSVPILEACPQIQSSTTLKVTLQCVPFVPDILVIPVFAHFFRHLLGNLKVFVISDEDDLKSELFELLTV